MYNLSMDLHMYMCLCVYIYYTSISQNLRLEVCNGGYLNGTDLTDHEEPIHVSSAVGCPDPNLCTVDVVQYTDDHQGGLEQPTHGWIRRRKIYIYISFKPKPVGLFLVHTATYCAWHNVDCIYF